MRTRKCNPFGRSASKRANEISENGESTETMADFHLPHDHGARSARGGRYRRVLADDARIFRRVRSCSRSLGDPTRVRIFWLLSHQEAVRHQSWPRCSTCPAPPCRTICARSPESGLLVSRRDGKEVYYRAADTVQESSLLHEIVEQRHGDRLPGKERGLSERVAGGDHPERPRPIMVGASLRASSRSKRCRASF